MYLRTQQLRENGDVKVLHNISKVIKNYHRSQVMIQEHHKKQKTK